MIKKEKKKDVTGECIVCGVSPTFELTGMCGPCTFGEAAMLGEGGTWPDPKGKK